MSASQCACCQNVREGETYEFYYGVLGQEREVVDPKYPDRSATMYRYDIQGTDSAFVCDACLEKHLVERRTKQAAESRRWGFTLLVPGVILGLLLAALVQAEGFRYGGVTLTGICVSILLIGAGAMSLRLALFPPTAGDRQDAGQRLAIEARRDAHPSGTEFWTARQYNSMKKPKLSKPTHPRL